MTVRPSPEPPARPPVRPTTDPPAGPPVRPAARPPAPLPRPAPGEGADLLQETLAIALDDRPKPVERAALFADRTVAEAVAAFRERYGSAAPEAAERARHWRRHAIESGHSLLGLSGAGYPPLLAEIAVPPIALEAAVADPGAPPVLAPAVLAAPAVAIVGARRATPYGIGVAEALAAGLAEAGFTVVSGLARGVDAAAHRAALVAGGRTVAVLGSALDCLYPPEHRDLARRCAASGAVVTEFPPGTRPLPHHFPRRNRIIAGLSLATVVVEAAERSGSLSTARHAADSNREVFAVPGPIGAPLSAGCNALLRSGAALVTGVGDILEELGVPAPPTVSAESASVPGTVPSPTGASSPPRTPAPPAPPEPGSPAAAVRETLRRFPAGVSFDDLLEACRLPVPAALAAVSELERRRLVERFPGDFLRARG